jgi:hypothetical protein
MTASRCRPCAILTDGIELGSIGMMSVSIGEHRL